MQESEDENENENADKNDTLSRSPSLSFVSQSASKFCTSVLESLRPLSSSLSPHSSTSFPSSSSLYPPSSSSSSSFSPSSQSHVLSKEYMLLLWEPIIQNRSENGDFDGCLEILEILRESSIPRNLLQWERTFSAAVVTKTKKQGLKFYLSRTYMINDLFDLLNMMSKNDNIIPSLFIFEKCLKYYSLQDNPASVVDIIVKMKNYGYPVNKEVLKEIKNMRRYDMVLELLDSI